MKRKKKRRDTMRHMCKECAKKREHAMTLTHDARDHVRSLRVTKRKKNTEQQQGDDKREHSENL